MTFSRHMEFHVSREARDRYQFDEALFALSGNVVFTNFHAARLFAQKMNQKRDLLNYPEQAVKAGQITAMGLIDEILHFVVTLFREQVNARVMEDALNWLDEKVGKELVNEALHRFTEAFPPVAVYRREITVDEYLGSKTDQTLNRQTALEEMVLLWLANMNPAFSSFGELFEDTVLRRETAYLSIISGLKEFFKHQPVFGPDDESLIDMLHRPAEIVPHSLAGQLEYIREHWAYLLGRYLFRLLGSLDILKEETKLPFLGAGPSEVYKYAGLELEAECFSPDKEWMPRLVLIAKNIYVWLHQLSSRYGIPISRLDEIPDAELDTLKRQGFSGLWLIGIWERSPASQKVKQLCGNPEAVSSAYSLFDYEVSRDLGGEDAFVALKDRARQRGIRLASDMVPNHMGIDSKWVIEHPDWFMSLDHSPFPWYSYNGTNLSFDDRVAISIEDHYYDRTDASVVFKRIDKLTGSERYIYHGNDGTSMPWNDTAQLNYLNPQVREAMIRTILHVARRFPVIRFDAAMTLTKKHFQRLWFPEPGTGGAIPTRAEYGFSKADFDRLMPQEFWREVVDRVAEEAPDTLLLAEAFWLLEGYFVRTLGMHRVYNSAFMNMLRDEDNAKYRMVMKNTLEFDPEVLRRFVNFMNNPDERTSVDQFGKDNKYFGVCIMMATMPGLPMFGHGQIEGLAEKYGMEYRRAYWEETPDPHLIHRHEREVFPLLHRRHLFAGVENFLLYDFFSPSGAVNEDVFTYSNRQGGERALVVYHNRDSHAAGWVRTSVAFSSGSGAAKGLVQKTLGEGLDITGSADYFTVFRDHVSGLEYIRPNSDLHEKGLYVELGNYSYYVFLNFREVKDNEWGHYRQLAGYLGGRGVPDVDEALKEIILQPIRYRFAELANPGLFKECMSAAVDMGQSDLYPMPGVDHSQTIGEFGERMVGLLHAIKAYTGGAGDVEPIAEEVKRRLSALLGLPGIVDAVDPSTETEQMRAFNAGLMGWLCVHALGRVNSDGLEADSQSRSWIDEWGLGRILADTYRELGFSTDAVSKTIAAIRLLTGHQHWFTEGGIVSLHLLLYKLFQDDQVQQFLGVNRYRDILWFNQESYNELLSWMSAVALLQIGTTPGASEENRLRLTAVCTDIIRKLRTAAEDALYQVERLMEIARKL